MTFEEIVDQASDMIRRRGQMSYRMLKCQFTLDDTYLDDLIYELIDIQQIAVDQDGRVLVWAGDRESASSPPTVGHQPPPIAYTPRYLTEKTLTLRSALEGERKQVTLLFADIKDSTEYRQTGQAEHALAALSTAIDMYRDIEMTFWLPETEAALAAVEKR